MKIQLERLIKCPKEILDKLEIIVSDNCSTDNTEEIVNFYIQKGLPCVYSKNTTNLGMDGNFVKCFKLAKARYVWLLGDDDCILLNSLINVVDRLSVCDEYGLVHIYCKEQKISNEQYLLYQDSNEFARTISYFTTFISANIVNTKYVPYIDFNKYMGTWFTLLPLYIKSFICEKRNLLINFPVFENPKDTKRNGGYNYFKVFVENYLNIWGEFVDSKKIKKSTFDYLKKDSFQDLILDHIFSFLILKKENSFNYNTNGAWSILFKHYWNNSYFYIGIFKYSLYLIKMGSKKILTF